MGGKGLSPFFFATVVSFVFSAHHFFVVVHCGSRSTLRWRLLRLLLLYPYTKCLYRVLQCLHFPLMGDLSLLSLLLPTPLPCVPGLFSILFFLLFCCLLGLHFFLLFGTKRREGYGVRFS